MKLFDQNTSFYMPAFFKIKLATSKQFEDVFGSEVEAVFFHEYLHFLQDVLTTYGLTNMSKVFNCIKDLYHQVAKMKSEDDFILARPIDFSGTTEINDELFALYLKYTNTKILSVDTEVCNILITQKSPYGDSGLLVNEYCIELSDGNKYYLGAHAIMECLCHTVQKKVYNSKYTLQVPYDLPLLVWNYYFKNLPEIKNNMNLFLDLLEFSLQFYHPAEILFKTIDILLNKSAVKFDIIESCFYNQLIRTWNSSDGENCNELYEKSLETVVKDVNGTLVSDVYIQYKNWIIQVLQNSNSYKSKNKFFFSKLYNMSIYEARQFISYMFDKIGLPPVYNKNGIIFIKGVIEEQRKVLSPFAYISFFCSQALLSVYSYLRGFSKGCDEDMRQSCIYINNATKFDVYNVDDKCTSAPFEKFNLVRMCPFTAVWNTLGLGPMQIF